MIQLSLLYCELIGHGCRSHAVVKSSSALQHVHAKAQASAANAGSPRGGVPLGVGQQRV